MLTTRVQLVVIPVRGFMESLLYSDLTLELFSDEEPYEYCRL